MRKKIVGIIALLTVSSVTFSLENGNINFRVGGDIHSKVSNIGNYSNGDTEDYGYEVGVEYTRTLKEKIDLGIGIAYQTPAKFSGNTSETSSMSGSIETETFKGYEDFKGYKSVPLYIVGKYSFNPIKEFTPYVRLGLGYSFNFGNEDIRYVDGEEREDESTDQDLGGSLNEAYSLSTKVTNGLYYSIGAGVAYHSWAIETIYQVTQADLEVQDRAGNTKKYDADYERITVVLSYKF